MAYIYQIRQRGTEKCYIGHTTKGVEVRWAAHLLLLGRGKHHSRYLQHAWNKYGIGEFDFELIEQCDDSEKLAREQFYIDTLDSCYNTARVAGSRLGVLFTEEQRIKLSAIRLGHPTSEEARRKIGEAHKGKKWKLGYKLTDEQRARCSAAQTGLSRPYAATNAAIARQFSPANKPGWVPTHRIGMKDSPEVIEKRRQSIIAAFAEKPFIWITDNERSMQFPADDPIPYGWYRGRLFSEEHKESVRAQNAAPKTAETKARMREARLRFLAENPDRHQDIVAAAPRANWYTDGVTSRKIPDGETVPEGWRRGRTMDAMKLVAARRPREKKPKVEHDEGVPAVRVTKRRSKTKWVVVEPDMDELPLTA